MKQETKLLTAGWVLALAASSLVVFLTMQLFSGALQHLVNDGQASLTGMHF